ncbi:DUF6470 family protein [Dehalobacter sp. DCM]|uniref:DUF6470 family protein n=1 Tax=Dehalobacter sp. DCM TaxID=2907827 RepID=UPI003081A1CF|nr:DUF6470 family protein [Dehalobacter sp. DCM]
MIDLQFYRQPPQLGLDIPKASYDLNVRKAEVAIQQAPAEIELSSTYPDVHVDTSAVRQALGYGGPEIRAMLFAQEAKGDFLENLEQTVQQGYVFADTTNRATIPEIVSRFAEPGEKELAVVPLPSISMRGIPSTLDFQAQLGGTETQLEDWGEVSIDNFALPLLKVYWEQEPYLKIEAVGQIVDVQE